MVINATELPTLINRMGRKKTYQRKTVNFIWIATTNDKFEFPIYVENSSKHLAKILNTTQSNVCHGATDQTTVKGFKIFKIEDMEE